MVPMWRSEENLVQLVLSSYIVGPGDPFPVVRPGHRHICPLSHVKLGSRRPYLPSHLTSPEMLERTA